MNLNNKMKKEVARAMTIKVHSNQIDKYLSECKKLILTAYESTYGDRNKEVLASGVCDSYLTYRNSINVSASITDNNVLRSGEMRWIDNPYFRMVSYSDFSTEGYSSTRLLKLNKKSLLPSTHFGNVNINGDISGQKVLAKNILKSNKTIKSIIDDTISYERHVLMVLEPLRTMKQLESVFPAAIPYFPKPAPKSTQIVPVELINSLTKKLHET